MKKDITQKTLCSIFKGLCIVFLSGMAFMFAGCDLGTSDNGEDTGTPPPAQIVGTAALASESATFTLNSESTPQTSLKGTRSVTSRALYTVTGSIRYRGVTLTLSGTYESKTFTFNVTSSPNSFSGESIYFRILGTYSSTNGFTGTIERYVNGTLSLVGSVTGYTQTTTVSAVNYLGTFSGGAAGTWNMTLQNGILTGTYSNYDPEAGSGTFKGTYSGSTLTFNSATNTAQQVVSFSGSGILSGTSMSGTWSITLIGEEGNETYNGMWSGAAATSQGDPHTPGSSDPLPYKFSLIQQAMQTAVNSTGFQGDIPDTYENDELSVRCVVQGDTPEAGQSTITITILKDFSDPITGIQIQTGSTLSMIFNSTDTPKMIHAEANMTFSNSPITTLVMFIDVDHTSNTISGTMTVDGTPITGASLQDLKNFFLYAY
jgi:hypothetical protein